MNDFNAKVLALSKEKFASFPNDSFKRIKENFWAMLGVVRFPPGVRFESYLDREAIYKAKTTLAAEILEEFERNQTELYQRAVVFLQSRPADDGLLIAVRAFKEKFLPVSRYNTNTNLVKRLVCLMPERDSFPCVKNEPSFHCGRYLDDALAVPYLDGLQTLISYVERRLYDDSIKGAKTARSAAFIEWRKYFATPEELKRVDDVLAVKKAEQSKLIPATPMSASNLKRVPDTNIEFAKSTQGNKPAGSSLGGDPYESSPKHPDRTFGYHKKF